MVAITVILAAVIGTFVLGLGDQVSDTTPQASFSFDFESNIDQANCNENLESGSGTVGVLSISHDGGDSIDEGDLSTTDGTDTIEGFSECDNVGDGSSVSAGTTVRPGINDDDTIRVVFESSNGGDSATLGKFDGPEA